MRIAVWQAPLLPAGSMAALAMISERVRQCEADRVDILLCPEGVLGGLADDVERPAEIALSLGDLTRVLAPLTSATLTTVIGFTEADGGALYNSAAIYARGEVAGVYRKRHPARRASVYAAGAESPVFEIAGVRVGIMICNDSNFPDLADDMVARGAELLLVPSNNGLRREIADVVEQTRAVDVSTARRCGVPVVRADVAGRTESRVAFGTSAIIDAQGRVVRAGAPFIEGLLVTDV